MKLEVFIKGPYDRDEYDAVSLSKTKSELKDKLMFLYDNNQIRVKERLSDLIEEYKAMIDQIDNAGQSLIREDEIHKFIQCKILCTRTLKSFK